MFTLLFDFQEYLARALHFGLEVKEGGSEIIILDNLCVSTFCVEESFFKL